MSSHLDCTPQTGTFPLKQLNKELERSIDQALRRAQGAGDLPEFDIPYIPVSPPKRTGQGDFSYPVMGLAKFARKKPLDIAESLVSHMTEPDFIKESRSRRLDSSIAISATIISSGRSRPSLSKASISSNSKLAPAKKRRSSLSAPTPVDRSLSVIRAALSSAMPWRAC